MSNFIRFAGDVYEQVSEAPASSPPAESAPVTIPADELYDFTHLPEWSFTVEAADLLPGPVAYSYWEPLASGSDGMEIVGVLSREVAGVPVKIRVKLTAMTEHDRPEPMYDITVQDLDVELLEPQNAQLQFTDGTVEALDTQAVQDFVTESLYQSVMMDKIIPPDLLDRYLRENEAFAKARKRAWRVM